MNSTVKNILIMLVLSALIISCAGIPPDYSEKPEFSFVEGKVWQLVAVRDPAKNIVLDRDAMENDGFGDYYTLQFLKQESVQIAGKASPNRYFGPYEQGEGRELLIPNVASTMMASFADPVDLKEYDYFAYLGKVRSWNASTDGQLELYTQNADGEEVILVYYLAD